MIPCLTERHMLPDGIFICDPYLYTPYPPVGLAPFAMMNDKQTLPDGTILAALNTPAPPVPQTPLSMIKNTS